MMRIGIISPGGTGNLGDEATVAAIIQEVRAHHPGAEIFGITTSPDDTRKRHQIRAIPARNNRKPLRGHNAPEHRQAASGTAANIRAKLKSIPPIYATFKTLRTAFQLVSAFFREMAFLKRSLKSISGTHLVIVAGSGQLSDNFYGVWGFPYTLLKWSVLTKVSGAKLVYLSCGAGPIDARLSRFFIHSALRLADYRSFRDADSKQLVESIGVRGKNFVVPDLVFSMKWDLTHIRSGDESRIVAINPFPHCYDRYSPVSDHEAYSSYIRRLAEVIRRLIQENHHVLLFPTQIRADVLVIEDLKRELLTDTHVDLERHISVAAVSEVNQIADTLWAADFVIASRFHGVLISFLINKPVIALSHHPKVSNLMRDMGQSDFLLDIDTFSWKAVARQAQAMKVRRRSIKDEIETRVAACRHRLEFQYRDVFKMIGTRRRSSAWLFFFRPSGGLK